MLVYIYLIFLTNKLKSSKEKIIKARFWRFASQNKDKKINSTRKIV